MIKRLFPATLIAGLAAGIVVSLTQVIFLLPLMDFAEFLEIGARSQDYVPPKGIFALAASNPERLLGTFAFDALTAIAFAMMLGGAIIISAKPISWKSGLIWGLGGWFAFSLAPAIGQPPSVPGAAYVDLAARQLWWWFAVSSTSVGLVLLVFIGDWAGECGIWAGVRKAWWPKVVGATLILLPHIYGAPQSTQMAANIPPELIRDFAFYSLVGTLAFWETMGAVLGFMLGRDETK